MYRISVIASDSKAANFIASSSLWKKHKDFEYAGCVCDENKAVEFLRATNTAMVFICAEGRSPEDITLIEHIRQALPEVYVVLASRDDSFKSVRCGFLQGIFDYLLLPASEDALEEILLRLYYDLGGKYIYRELKKYIPPLIEGIKQGSKDVSPLCRRIIDKIFERFAGDFVTAYMVSEKTKTYIYDVLMNQAPWLRKLVYKSNFTHTIGSPAESREEVTAKWSADFQAIADTTDKYSLLDNPLISNIGYYVINHVDERLSLEQVSAAVFLNKSYISHIFKKVSGISFVNFITQVKTDRAKILLMDPNLKIYEIAAQIGYNNPEYFSRVFKAVTGATPNRYRASLNIKAD